MGSLVGIIFLSEGVSSLLLVTRKFVEDKRLPVKAQGLKNPQKAAIQDCVPGKELKCTHFVRLIQ
jgi:hypothetical protein